MVEREQDAIAEKKNNTEKKPQEKEKEKLAETDFSAAGSILGKKLDAILETLQKTLSHSGEVYEKQDFGDDEPHPFQKQKLLLHDATLQVTGNTLLIGSPKLQRIEIAAGSSYGFTKPVNISTLYIKNKTKGLNAVAVIMGTVG